MQPNSNTTFDLPHLLHELKHFLPAQAPLKDFIHHNSLHAFQTESFFEALKNAADTFGYKTFLTLNEFRTLYAQGKIDKAILEKVVCAEKGETETQKWIFNLVNKKHDENVDPQIGALRSHWKSKLNFDLETFVSPLLFRTLCSYLDQGISIWDFPVQEKGFLASIRTIEKNSFSSFFKTKKVKNYLLDEKLGVEDLLKLLIGDEKLFEQYIFDQQFSHQGWSGMVAVVEELPQTLLINRPITLQDLIHFELLLELDALEDKLGKKWKPLASLLNNLPTPLFEKRATSELDEVIMLWQKAFEWSFYDQVLTAIQTQKGDEKLNSKKSFQAAFCIDDRECSFRRYVENLDENAETFGTPGFFGVEFFFQPQGGKFTTKVCPAPVTPKYLIKEIGKDKILKKDIHLSKHSHNFLYGFFLTQTVGYWSAFKLLLSLFRPSMSTSAASSHKHMDKAASLTIENKNLNHRENDLQIGFTIEEMAIRVENVLRSIGLVENFAPLVYIIGHGASSVNNPHYAAYDCGACSGRAGSVNARVFSFMANHATVRAILKENGIEIPAETQFVGAIHDTTRDEIVFFDEEVLYPMNAAYHLNNERIFEKALDLNAKERSRRFESIDSQLTPHEIHDKILTRSVSLFEPRPELNHATNSLCIIGRREISKHVFLDRRAFLNSYDYRVDPTGKYLLNILNAAAPVCGGINLEYYFSRVDNQKLGAGTKLPHNVMGLFGVANGIDGDLRPGLPSQMIEVHDPVRLLMIVEHFPEIVLETIQKNPATFEWFKNEWVVLVVSNPETNELLLFKENHFVPYNPISSNAKNVVNINSVIEASVDNLPVFLINKN